MTDYHVLHNLEERVAAGGYVSDDAILAAGGCPYCAMTGYEDYPSCKKPCRKHPTLGAEMREQWIVFCANQKTFVDMSGWER